MCALSSATSHNRFASVASLVHMMVFVQGQNFDFRRSCAPRPIVTRHQDVDMLWINDKFLCRADSVAVEHVKSLFFVANLLLLRPSLTDHTDTVCLVRHLLEAFHNQVHSGHDHTSVTISFCDDGRSVLSLRSCGGLVWQVQAYVQEENHRRHSRAAA